MQVNKPFLIQSCLEPFLTQSLVGQMKDLQNLLNHFRKKKDNVLLFSFSAKLLDVLEQCCLACGLDCGRLNGNTKEGERVKTAEELNSMGEVNISLVACSSILLVQILLYCLAQSGLQLTFFKPLTARSVKLKSH